MSGDFDDKIFLGAAGGEAQFLRLDKANRHGLVAGATGTGKTVTLQILAEGFASAGVPVFAADIKGDLSGLASACTSDHRLHEKLQARADKIGLTPYEYTSFPVRFWDVYGEVGLSLRSTVDEMGPVLLSRLLDLNDTQEGLLTIAFEVAESNDLLLLDLKDLRALLTFIGKNRADISTEYGHVSTASIGAIQRKLLVLDRAGGDVFFGEPRLELADFMMTDRAGFGMINLIDATKLMQNPRIYATFLLWLLSELIETLPEVGDPEKPKLVFFFDEAHLLFKDAPKVLLEKIEQVVKLIRSKGVGLFFVTQNPRDIPDPVLAQLSNRIQHALRAYTPNEQKAVRAAARSFRAKSDMDVEQVIMQLGIGEALVSTLDEKAVPNFVAQTLVRPPSSQIGAVTDGFKKQLIASDPLRRVYGQPIDRESAYEKLEARRLQLEKEEKQREALEIAQKEREKPRSSSSRRRRQTIGEAAAKSAARTIARQTASTLTRALLRGLLGGLRR